MWHGDAARDAERIATTEATRNEVGIDAVAAAGDAIKNMGDKIIVVEAAKIAWKYAITNEEKITAAISSKLQGVERRTTFDRDMAFNHLLLDGKDLGTMILPARCWYFTRVYQIVSFDPFYKRKFLKLVPQHGSVVTEFIEWIIGVKYSVFDLQKLCTEISFILPSVLVSIVYAFVAPPTREEVKRTLLSLIG